MALSQLDYVWRVKMKTQSNNLLRLYKNGDKIMLGVIWFLFAMSLGMANWYSTWSEALWIGLPSAIVPTVLVYLMSGKLITRLVIATSYMVFCALHIHQAHGMIEIHFGIFVLLAFLLVYRDWLPIVTAAAVIAVHHLSFNFLQVAGYGVYLFSDNSGLGLVILHAAYVVFETAILIYMSVQFRKEAIITEELIDIGQHMAVVDGKIDLHYRKENASSAFAHDYNHFIDAVSNAIRSSQDTAEHLLASTAQMQSQSDSARQGVTRQQVETDQVATAINEMTATVQEVARSATDAATAAHQADQEANNGKGVVAQTVSSIQTLASNVEQAADVIQKLEQDTTEIGGVLDVIKGIADQTNLLALNAAIEAARAGEQGRGFAVVADEVRTLASRTQESTEEINNMIDKLQLGAKNAVAVMEDGREQARTGVEQASKAGDSLSAITHSVATINDMNTQIASAADEQSKVAEEINRNVVNISQVANETASNVTQVADKSSELEGLASVLTTEVERFKV